MPKHAAALVLLGALIWASPAFGHYKPGRHNAYHAVNQAWCGRANLYCEAAKEALSVAKCESGAWWDYNNPREARNGQYRGMFQMGSGERERWGHGLDPWSQAKAAHRYWMSSGWNPWQCKPWYEIVTPHEIR